MGITETGRVEPRRTGVISRRSFAFIFGAGSAATLTGFFLLKNSPVEPEQGLKSSRNGMPMLATGLVFEQREDLMVVTRPGEKGEPLCGVNTTGAEILNRLDGRHTVEQISEDLAQHFGLERTGELDARVAWFVAQAGMAGLLSEPFYVQVFERTVS